jgi:hypothetical protein
MNQSTTYVYLLINVIQCLEHQYTRRDLSILRGVLFDMVNVTSQMSKSVFYTLITNVKQGLNQSSKDSIEFPSNSKSITVFEFLFKFHRDLDQVPITKLVPNHLIYLLENFQIFMKLLAISPAYFLFYMYWKRVNKNSFPFCSGLDLPTQPNPLTDLTHSPATSSLRATHLSGRRSSPNHSTPPLLLRWLLTNAISTPCCVPIAIGRARLLATTTSLVRTLLLALGRSLLCRAHQPLPPTVSRVGRRCTTSAPSLGQPLSDKGPP